MSSEISRGILLNHVHKIYANSHTNASEGNKKSSNNGSNLVGTRIKIGQLFNWNRDTSIALNHSDSELNLSLYLPFLFCKSDGFIPIISQKTSQYQERAQAKKVFIRTDL